MAGVLCVDGSPRAPSKTNQRLDPEDGWEGRALYLNVHESHLVAQKERTGLFRGVDQLRDLVLEVLRMLDLRLFILSLQIPIEAGDDVTVDLFPQSAQRVLLRLGMSILHGPTRDENELSTLGRLAAVPHLSAGLRATHFAR